MPRMSYSKELLQTIAENKVAEYGYKPEQIDTWQLDFTLFSGEPHVYMVVVLTNGSKFETDDFPVFQEIPEFTKVASAIVEKFDTTDFDEPVHVLFNHVHDLRKFADTSESR